MLERRGFVTGLLTVLSSVIEAVFGIPLVGYTVLPALIKRLEVWTDAGAEAELVPGRPRELKIYQTITGGRHKTT